MHLEGDNIALHGLPATNASASAIETITTAYLPAFIEVCLTSEDISFRDLIGIFRDQILPTTEEDMQVRGQFAVGLDPFIDNLELLSKSEDLCLRIVNGDVYHMVKIGLIYNVTGNMETEVTNAFAIIVDLLPIFVGLVNSQRSIDRVILAHVRTEICQLGSIAFRATSVLTTTRAGNKGQRANRGDSAHFSITRRKFDFQFFAFLNVFLCIVEGFHELAEDLFIVVADGFLASIPHCLFSLSFVAVLVFFLDCD